MGADITNTILAFSGAITSLVSLGGLWLNWTRMSRSERNGAAENAARRMVEHGERVENNAVELAHGVHHAEPVHHPNTGTTDGATP